MRVLIDTPKPAQLVPGRLLVAKASTRAVFAPTPRKASMLPVAWRIVSIAPEQMKLNPQKKHEKSALGHSEKPVKLITYIKPPKTSAFKIDGGPRHPRWEPPRSPPLEPLRLQVNSFSESPVSASSHPWQQQVPRTKSCQFVSMCLIA